MKDKELNNAFLREVEGGEDIAGEWHAIEEAPAGEQARALKHKWEELALDVALLPDKNVRLVASEKGERVEISDTLYQYFFGS
jgi:hypothetical protein